MKSLKSAVELEKLRKKILSTRDPNDVCIVTSVGTCGLARGSNEVVDAIRKELDRQKLADSVSLRTTGCHGFCEIEPVVVVYPQRIVYQHVKPEDVPEIITETIVGDHVVERLVYADPVSGEKAVHEQDIPFYKKQKRLLLDANELIDPLNIEDYVAIGGYCALARVLKEFSPEGVIEEVKKAGLRGRGGGGFPAARKWESCRNAPTNNGTRYVICNADEGDPGAYMDRSLLEGNPHSVLEGMLIGAYAIGSNTGYVYVRHEYPLAVQNLTIALEQAREYGLIGGNILGTDFSFDLKISRGGGAFVCGESTALMASLEGQIGEPRPKHIHTVVAGLHDKPTNLNNVETWANVPLIIDKGADWYSKIGTENSKGTKIFSLVGKINNTGLVEVPMGITLKEIIYDIGGGIPKGKKFKAVQTGGPSGGCIPESLIDIPVDFDKLYEVGSMMGSGGMIVMDEDTCMIDIAKYFIKFLTEESCGKCTPCREGLDRMLDILTDITEGKGKEADIELLEELGEVITDTSLCALGGTSANPVMSTIRYFRNEYSAHIKDKKCPAGVCKALITFTVDEEKCTGCLLCKKVCPQEAISGEKKQPHEINQELCIKCGLCRDKCKKFDAIIVS
ncbi:MAG: NADH-quinone oxidoreductase subunit F [Planctomycetota bacterium]|nr:MAG: NADH-quinone oxidoreductase subunit F [Planctomycetota bacterium]